MPKPDGLVRVVVLGDSFVFGSRVDANERLGVFLEEELKARAGSDKARRLEVLHIGIGSWNTLAECAFLERQLSDMDPDLVVQVFIGNDLNDNQGVRGFGVRSDFDPARPERANGRVSFSHPTQELGGKERNPILYGLDGESRQRYADAFGAMGRLRDALAARGAEYLLVLTAAKGPAIGKVALVAAREVLDDDAIVVLDEVFLHDRAYRFKDGHWNPDGHRRVATMLYGIVHARGLLAELELAPWSEADGLVESMHAAALRRVDAASVPPPFPVDPELVLAKQVYGGLDKEDRASPYASFVLEPRGRASLVLRGAFLPRAELTGTVTVSIDGEELERFAMQPGEAFERAVAVPGHLSSRSHVAVQLSADAWALLDNGRACRSYVLEHAGFVE